jgi:hypothetical protein
MMDRVRDTFYKLHKVGLKQSIARPMHTRDFISKHSKLNATVQPKAKGWLEYTSVSGSRLTDSRSNTTYCLYVGHTKIGRPDKFTTLCCHRQDSTVPHRRRYNIIAHVTTDAFLAILIHTDAIGVSGFEFPFLV